MKSNRMEEDLEVIVGVLFVCAGEVGLLRQEPDIRPGEERSAVVVQRGSGPECGE